MHPEDPRTHKGCAFGVCLPTVLTLYCRCLTRVSEALRSEYRAAYAADVKLGPWKPTPAHTASHLRLVEATNAMRKAIGQLGKSRRDMAGDQGDEGLF